MASNKSNKKSKGGIILGIILIIIGSVFLVSNEKNNVKNIKTVDELRKKVVDVSDAKVLTKNNGKLVAVSGSIDYDEQNISDPVFNVTAKTPKLVRTVESYQWVEDTENNGDTVNYSYKKEWSSKIIDSDVFNNTEYSNPKTREYDTETYLASNIKLGEYYLSENQKVSLNAGKELSIKNMEGIYLKSGFNIVDEYITNSKDYSKPEIGDIRIKYTYNDSTNISVLALQDGNGFTDFISKAGKKINKVYAGKLNSTHMIDKIAKTNNMKKWIFRGIGALIIIIGYISLFNLVTFLLEYIPALGKVASSLIKLIAGLIGFIHSLLIIVIAWFRYRPILSLILGVIITAIVLLIIFKTKKVSKTENEISQ